MRTAIERGAHTKQSKYIRRFGLLMRARSLIGLQTAMARDRIFRALWSHVPDRLSEWAKIHCFARCSLGQGADRTGQPGESVYRG